MARLMIHSILVALFIVFGSAAAEGPVVNTPLGVAQCLPSSISFGQGVPPYYISVIPGGQPSAASLLDFPQLSESPYRWVVNQPAGTSITLRIRDSSGQLNYSQQVTVQPGTDSSCLSGSGSTPSPAPAPTTPQPPATPNTTSASPATTTGVSTPPTSNTSASMNMTPTKNTTTSTNSTKGSSPFIAPANTTSTTPNPTTPSDTPAAAAANSAAATLGFSLSALSTPFVVGMIISLLA